ncbi:IS256 family transposase [Lewinella sp. IMCC34191]|uniref:IS256 family transposase n=1 Tax=Lewinella sp. IMCC34191 TaxID=2259172 RepID=UPI000E23146B|nr:IS256 family transposase [Lewinella sp. IMCC34191]
MSTSSNSSRKFADFEADLIQGLMNKQPLAGPDGLLNGLIKHVVEAALAAELDAHLDDNRQAGIANKRNGRTRKEVRTDFGPVAIEGSRDRNGTFEPVTVGKRQYDLAPHMTEQILSLYARGNSERDIAAQLEQMLGNQLSPAAISAVIQRVWPQVTEWQQRGLKAFYSIVYADAIHFKIRREGRTDTVAIYTLYGVDADGQRDLLLLELGDGAEGATQWGMCLERLKQRGVEDILVVCADGLTGFDQVVEHYFPQAIFQRCVVHIMRNCMRGVDYRDRRPLCADLRQVYQSNSRSLAAEELEVVRTKWGRKYAHVFRLWDREWDAIMAFKDFGPELQRMIYTTNPVENVHRLERKVTKTKGSWVSGQALLIQLYLGLQAHRKSWYRQAYNWTAVSRELSETYGDRFTKHWML